VRSIFITIITAAFGVAQLFALPLAQCDQAEIDLGSHPAGARVGHDFIISNAGDEPLNIAPKHVCCGATLSLSVSNILPAANALARFDLKLSHQPGRWRRSLYLATNDTKNPYLRLTLSGSVTNETHVLPFAASDTTGAPGIKSFPAAIELPRKPTSDEITHEVILRGHQIPDFNIRSVQLNGADGQIYFTRLADGAWHLRFKRLTWLANSGNDAGVTVCTDAPAHPRFFIPLLCPADAAFTALSKSNEKVTQ